ncbi:MAG: threonine-phosphate decarboxylase CobD [Nitrospirota bacterium]
MTKEISNTLNAFEHGGNIYRLAEELKIQERKIIDFSASVNPLGVSKKIKAELRGHLKYLHNYPDPETKRLRKRLAQYHGIDPETILCGNGSTELIYLIIRTLKPQRVLIPAPTYSEYEKAVLISHQSLVISQQLANKEKSIDIKYLNLKENEGFRINPNEFIVAMEGELPSFDMAFLCNPNNPTGRLLKMEDVLKIADTAKEIKCYLIVDESFIDFCHDESVITEVENNPYLIVLKSMTKFYALSGLRIGYGVFPRNLINNLKEYKEPWTVNSLSQRAAIIALKDKAYRQETLRIIKEEKRFLERNFKKIGIEFFNSDANFYLLKISNAVEICQRLKKKGILVRECSNFKGVDSSYLRIAVKSHRENTILIKKLASILQAKKDE